MKTTRLYANKYWDIILNACSDTGSWTGWVSEQRAPWNLSGKSLGKEKQYLQKAKKGSFKGEVRVGPTAISYKAKPYYLQIWSGLTE